MPFGVDLLRRRLGHLEVDERRIVLDHSRLFVSGTIDFLLYD
jgi:hypothetical protein